MMPVNWHPCRRQLRTFGLVCLVVFGALATWALVRESIFGLTLAPPMARAVALSLGALAALSALMALVAPAALRPLYVALMAVSVPIGYVVSHAVMAVVFFGLLLPIGIAFRLMRRDALARNLDRVRPTYWEPRRTRVDVRRYYRQF
jgi:Saxitoxin biosynthesis operon protein SxtJ